MMTDFHIKGFIGSSFIDWPGKICSVVFLGGCGFRCPACHNAQLVEDPQEVPDYPFSDILRYLETRRNWIDGVTVSGGEPTIHHNLPELLRALRDSGFLIKLDTNGSHPAMIRRLIDLGLVDAVFMDIKAPLTRDQYGKVAGVPIDVRFIRRSIDILKGSSIEVVFRTTVVPGLVEEAELAGIRAALGDARRFVVQAFRSVQTLDPSLTGIREFSPARVEQMRRDFEVTPCTVEAWRTYAVAGIA
ncbi:MAG: anaerobic ribonucleoside-triphosphate reductase activating protein [Desulfomonile tiedjei]|nr:anaerobic ribonucleoside-triphosphate reductase activating protein [Desulfomonile tiedjei]